MIYELDVAIPKEKPMGGSHAGKRIMVTYDGGNITEWLEEQLKKVS
jgi:hypothetical protein